MDSLPTVIIIAAAVILGIVLIRLLGKPLQKILKLLLNAVFGYALLFVVNFFGDPVGIHIEINLLNAIITGILGIPGVLLLVLYQVFM